MSIEKCTIYSVYVEDETAKLKGNKELFLLNQIINLSILNE